MITGLRNKSVYTKRAIVLHKPLSNKVGDILIVTILAFTSQYCAKLVEDCCEKIREQPFDNYKKRSKEIKKFMTEDPFSISCHKITRTCQEILNSIGFEIKDEDTELVWLTIDSLLVKKISRQKFVVPVSMLALIFSQIKEFKHENSISETNKVLFSEVEFELTKLNDQMMQMYYEEKKTEADSKGLEYDEFVFGFFASKEYEYAEKTANEFVKNFETYKKLKSFAEIRKKELGEEYTSVKAEIDSWEGRQGAEYHRVRKMVERHY